MTSELTKRSFIAGCACACCAPIAGRAGSVTGPDSAGGLGKTGLPTLLELGSHAMQRVSESLWVARITPGFWLHTTTATILGGIVFPANGLILERAGGSLLIDTCYTGDQARALVEWAKGSLAAPITKAIGTHFHNDRIGGVDGLKQVGIPTYAFPLTATLAAQHGQPAPQPIPEFTSRAYKFDEDCELYFPGPGHTRDNIAAWFPGQHILFGGCLLKSTTSANLGNVADAVIADWAPSVQRLAARYQTARYVIPGHGTMDGNAIAQTLTLLAKTKRSGG